jgi:hypothetical protein
MATDCMHAFMCCWRPGGGLPAGAKFERKSHYARRALIGRISGRVLPAGEHLVPVAALEATADQSFPATDWWELSLEWVAEAVLEIADHYRTFSYERPKVAGHRHHGATSQGLVDPLSNRDGIARTDNVFEAALRPLLEPADAALRSAC